jgi:hypothetical protein
MAWQRKGKEKERREGRREERKGKIQSTMGMARKLEHIFKPMLIYPSSQMKQIKTGKKNIVFV